jgi:hypothetical protein
MLSASLPRAEWQSRRAAHIARVRRWADDRVTRMASGVRHPVYDFLFEYYSFRPAHLLRWSPGVGVMLDGATPEDSDWRQWSRACNNGVVIPADRYPSHRLPYLRWAIRYLETTGRREPVFGCFGLHEWAMVYREPEVRHGRVPLRLSRADTDAVTEAGPLRCTHYDAFRFFTQAAAPRNRFPLTRDAATDHDQPGCVHVTMDLYKFAYKIAPFSSAETVADAFELAIAARELDMRASPYDLSGYGFAPVRIETKEGREEYAAGQQELYHRAKRVRERVLAEYRGLEAFL